MRPTLKTLFFFFLIVIQINAQKGFVRNLGQLKDQHKKVNPSVQFILSNPGLNIQLKDNGISYDSYRFDEASQLFKFQRVDMEFIDADNNLKLEAFDKTNFNIQTFSDNKKISLENYNAVRYKNLYDGIDLICHIDQNGKFEYDFEIQPGANPNQIQWRYNGAVSSYLNKEGKIELNLGTAILTEEIPLSCLGNEILNIRYRQISENSFSFDLPEYNSTNTLVIDPLPTLHLSTYYGGTALDEGDAIATHPNGEIIIAGGTASVNFIATSGAFQSTFKGDKDGFLARFDNGGTLISATYLGDTAEDWIRSIAIDTFGNLYAAGYSASLNNFSTAGVNQPTNAGAFDAFLSKFDAAGNRVWTTFFGGSGDDFSTSVAVNQSGDIIIGGYTVSTSGIANGTVHQSQYAGNTDAFIASFDTAGQLNWSTYYGGTGEDIAYALKTDNLNNIIISGETKSTNIVTQATFQSAYSGGSSDAFFAKFNNNGILIWDNYYGGSLKDFATSIETDASNNVYLAGITNSTDRIAYGNAFQNTLGGNDDAFISRFSEAGLLEWSTYFGGTGSESNEILANTKYGNRLTLDNNNNLYLCGQTNSTTRIATQNSAQPNNKGGYDAFVAKFSGTGDRRWSSYYGGNNTDYAAALTIDANDRIYMTGLTFSNNISSPNVHQDSLKGSKDAFLAVFCDYPEPFYGPFKDAYCESEIISLQSLDANASFFVNGQLLNNNFYQANPNYSTNSIGNIRFDTLVHIGQWNGCAEIKDTVLLRILPVFKEYNAVFEQDNGSFWTTDNNTKWSVQTNNNNHFWATYPDGNGYSANDSAFVYSACFDLTESVKTAFVFDYFSETQTDVDGTRMEYLDSASQNWLPFAEAGDGYNMYNSGVAAFNFESAWTGILGDSLFSRNQRAFFPADSFNGQNIIRLRFHFQSFPIQPIDNFKGFGFDNFRLAKAKKEILVEGFINKYMFVYDECTDSLYNELERRDLRYIQYHIQDHIYDRNISETNSRLSFYGIPLLTYNPLLQPQTVISGNLYNSNTYDTLSNALIWADTNFINTEPYQPLEYKISIDSLFLNTDNDFSVNARVERLKSFDPNEVVYVAVIDTAFIDLSLNNDTIKNMFVKMLPNAGGISMTSNNVLNLSEVLTSTISYTTDLNRLGIMIWVQNLNNKKIYQAAYGTMFNLPDNQLIPVRVEKKADEPLIFPVPFSNFLNIDFKTSLTENSKWEIVNELGQVVRDGSFEHGNQIYSLNLEEINSGLYFLKIYNKSSVFVKQIVKR